MGQVCRADAAKNILYIKLRVFWVKLPDFSLTEKCSPIFPDFPVPVETLIKQTMLEVRFSKSKRQPIHFVKGTSDTRQYSYIIVAKKEAILTITILIIKVLMSQLLVSEG